MARTQSARSLLNVDDFVASETPVSLSIAGSDSSAGAGLQADLKTMTALGAHGLTAVTAVVAETPKEVAHIHPVPVAVLDGQLAILFASYPIRSVKTGMFPSPDHVSVAVRHLVAWKRADPGACLVVDPVMVASTEDELASAGTQDCLEKHLLPLADLMTPNMGEAERLLASESETPTHDPAAMARQLSERFQTAVLLKGGHARSDDLEVTDFFCTRDQEVTSFSGERIHDGHRLHGTGCTLSAAIAAYLAQRWAMEDAIAASKDYVSRCMENARHWPGGVSALGSGITPPHL